MTATIISMRAKQDWLDETDKRAADRGLTRSEALRDGADLLLGGRFSAVADLLHQTAMAYALGQIDSGEYQHRVAQASRQLDELLPQRKRGNHERLQT